MNEVEVFSPKDVAMAAAVPVDQVRDVVESEQILVVNGHMSQADAVRLVRGFARGELGRAPLTLLRPTRRKGSLPLAASGMMHAAFVALLLVASSLGLLKANDTETHIEDPTPVRMVFMMLPGPGGGGGGGGNAIPLPPPPAKAKAPAPAPRKISVPVPKPPPYRPPPRPVTRPTPPQRLAPVQPIPVRPTPERQKPMPVVQAPVAPMAADTDDQAGLLNSQAPPSTSQGRGTGGGAGSGQGTGLGEGNGAGIGEGSDGGTGGGPFRPGSGIEPPLLRREVKPVYTDEGRRRAIEGDVVMEIVVRRDGSVGDVRLMRTLGSGLDQRAIAAVKQWRFAPARRKGAAVDVLVEVAVGFALR